MTGRLVAAAILVLGAAWAVAEDLAMLPLGDPQRAYAVASLEAGSFYDCREGTVLDLEAAAGVLARARVILLGEEHTSMDQKRTQARLLEALAARKPGLVLGMEFFQRGDDGVLARWTSGELEGDDFLLASGWYDRGGYNWVYYAPVMETARKLGIPVVGLNVERSIPRTVSRKGLDALDPGQRKIVGEVDVSGSPQHRYLIARYFGDTVSLLPPAWFDRMYASQCLWDVVMARSILDKLPPEGTMVVLVGSGHVAFGLSIARRIHEELARRGEPDIEVSTFVPVTAPAPDPGGDPSGHPMPGGGKAGGGRPALFVRSVADVVGAFPDRGGVEEVPRLGLKLEEGGDGAILVKQAWPDSPASAAGLVKGDRIVDLGGTVPGDIHRLRLALARLRWGDRLDLRVEREGATVDCVALLEPELLSVDREVAPGWTVEAAGGFDPTAPSPVLPLESARASTLERRLVSRDGTPSHVEVWRDGVLVEVHRLDAGGRVLRSLFRDPLADGTVEIVYRRDGGGTVTGVTRLDRSGRPVG